MTSSGGRPQLGTLRALVNRAGDESLRRASRRSAGWWRTETAPGRTRADAVAELVAALAATTARLEGEPERTPPRPPRDDVLVDQLAVVLYDLALVLDDADAATAALAGIVATTHEVDPRPVANDLVDAVLAGQPGPLRDLVERLPRERHP